MKRLILSLMVISFTLLFSFGALALPKNGLVLHYNFEKGSINGDNVKDLSGNGNDAKLNGGAKAANGGLELDGKNGYVGGPALGIRTGGEIPFSALGWFTTNEPKNGPLWMWGDNANPSSSSGAEGPVGWRASTGKFAAGFYQNGHFYADGEDTYADGELHFVAQVGTENTGYLYIDGEQISSTTAGYIYAAPPYFILGARSKNSGSDIDDIEYFKGFFKQVALYNFAMSEAEIKAIAEEEAAVSSSGKLANTWGKLKK